MAKGDSPAVEASGALEMTDPSSSVSGTEVEDGESSTRASCAEKDPRKIARNYQMEICKKAVEENIIVYLGTGCGKTHIAVLLIYELGHLIRKPQKNICVFLAPTVALVHQQAKVIEDSVDFKVGIYCGHSKHLKSHYDWEKEIEQYEVLVMTPEVLLRNLCHCFIRMELIALLIFDECHHAQLESNHPYAEILKVFYKKDVIKLPRILGMTASPKLGKGASISGLEALLHAKIYAVEDKEELESFVTSPKVKVYHYSPIVNNTSNMIFRRKLEEIKHQCTSILRSKTDDFITFRSIKKVLWKLHGNLIFCLESLGLWGALKACRILLRGDHFERNELIETEANFSDDSVCDKYLAQADSVFASGCPRDGGESNFLCADVFQEPHFSKKLLCLIQILSTFRAQPDMKCIVFVNRIFIARSLSCILGNLKILESWKCNFLIGVHSGLKSASRKAMSIILDKFRSDELNLLVATKVGEEGLDIQTCCLVVRFDLPQTVGSFIQSRGRARMPQSEYAFMVDSGNQDELNLINSFQKAEVQMNEEIALIASSETFVEFEEKTYEVESTGATIGLGYCISLLHRFCSKLPHDEYFCPKPEFYYFDNPDGTVCHIILPSNAPMHEIVGTPQSSRQSAKRDACLKACEELHKMDALTNYLLPDLDNSDKEGLVLDSSDSESGEGEDSRGELHEMLVPAALKEPWNNLENPVRLKAYFIKFNPIPVDRLYKEFGLFVKATLPAEAEKMELDLHLARGRSVTTAIVPSGVVDFDKQEIMQAQNFQEMFLKIILDRSEFIPEFVPLGKSDFCTGPSTFYLLLPVILHEHTNKMTVDWKIVRRCLSSPIFRSPAEAIGNGISPANSYLQLYNGPTSINDVENSLVFAPYNTKFFFVCGVLHDKNSYSPFKNSTSHMDRFSKMPETQLLYPMQPLLKVKELFCLRNLLHNRKQQNSESHELEEQFSELPPELCHLKIIGFSKDIGSSISLLPSIMHRLENLLVAIQLKHRLSAFFPEGTEVTAHHVLEALTTEKCNECFSLERLETLGDAFLKFAVGRHLFLLYDAFNEGQLTKKRSKIVNNSNLFKLAIMSNIQVYIRDQSFVPSQFFALGRPCPVICDKESEATIHSQCESSAVHGANFCEVRCNKQHHWLHKKTIADVVEALIGAFIVDSGFKAATAFLKWIGIQVDFDASQVNNVFSTSMRFLSFTSSKDIDDLEKRLGYQFVHRGLLLQAFVHPSYNKHGGGCYQRLEFLGDAVLDYLITSYLYSAYPKLKPGLLTDLRSACVNNNAFANVAVSLFLDKFIICDSSSLSEAIDKYVKFMRAPVSETALLERPKCQKVLSDLVESCFGAILLDTAFDLNFLWKIMLSFLDPSTRFSSLKLSPIRELQEFCQYHNWELQFPAFKKGEIFTVEAKVDGKVVCSSACASNRSKKDAKRMAAEQLLTMLKAQGFEPKSKSLGEILKLNCKMEPKLVGYDERPVVLRPPRTIESESLMLKESSSIGSISRTKSIDEKPTELCSPTIKNIKESPSPVGALGGKTSKTIKRHTQNASSQDSGGSLKKTARSRLYELCNGNCWDPPLFECCKEEGQSHSKLFTFKVVVVLEETSNTILECFGAPQSTKKAAAEHAAEGAIWYLSQSGYIPNYG